MGYNQREMEIHRQELNEFEATRTNYHRDCASKYTPSFLLCLNFTGLACPPVMHVAIMRPVIFVCHLQTSTYLCSHPTNHLNFRRVHWYTC
jgi:hypothetical protein